MFRRFLLACGLLSFLAYVAIDLLGARSYPGYDYAAQAVSEMSAVGAPTARLLAPLYPLYSLLFGAFGVGLWLHAGGAGRLRIVAGCILAVALLGCIAWPLFPMHARGAARDFSDTVHLALGGTDVVLLAAAIAFGAQLFGPAFRLYSWATILVMLLFGLVTARYVPAVAAGGATPLLGVAERISLGAYLLWMAVLSLRLVRLESFAPADRTPAAA